MSEKTRLINDAPVVQRVEKRAVPTSQRLVACVVLLLMVFLWVGMAEVGAAIQKGGCGKQDKPFHKPFFMTFVIHAGYAVFLIAFVIWEGLERLIVGSRWYTITPPTFPSSKVISNRWKTQRHILLHSIWCGLLSFFVGYFFYMSLPLISVAANTSIYNSASAFVYIFCLLFRMEHFQWLKLVALIVSVAGVVMVQFLAAKHKKVNPCPGMATPKPTPTSTGHSTSEETLGFIFVVVSTITYALYEVLYKRVFSPDDLIDKIRSFQITSTISDESFVHNPDDLPAPSSIRQIKYAFLVLGLLGLVQIVLMWPGFFLLDMTGLEPFEWPQGVALTGLLATTGMDALFNVGLLIGIALTSPLFISVGCLLTVPMSIFADWYFHHQVMSAGSLAGVGLICVGFLLISYAEYKEEKQK